MATLEVKVPDIGDFKEVEVIEVLVKPGDRVEKEQSLITVESDKASMEIPSPAAGVVKSMAIKMGSKVSQGSVILQLEGSGAATPEPEKVVEKEKQKEQPQPANTQATSAFDYDVLVL